MVQMHAFLTVPSSNEEFIYYVQTCVQLCLYLIETG